MNASKTHSHREHPPSNPRQCEWAPEEIEKDILLDGDYLVDDLIKRLNSMAMADFNHSALMIDENLHWLVEL